MKRCLILMPFPLPIPSDWQMLQLVAAALSGNRVLTSVFGEQLQLHQKELVERQKQQQQQRFQKHQGLQQQQLLYGSRQQQVLHRPSEQMPARKLTGAAATTGVISQSPPLTPPSPQAPPAVESTSVASSDDTQAGRD